MIHFFTSSSGLASDTVSAIQDARFCDLVCYFERTEFLSNGRWKTYTAADGAFRKCELPFEDSSGTLWIGTSGGLAFQPGRVRSSNLPESPRGQIFGIAKTKWMAVDRNLEPCLESTT
jgi:hypothetical protein